MDSSWSPFHELQPDPPLRHGHAISIDMAYTATLAHERGMLSKEEHTRILRLFSRAGLSIDHPLYDETAIEKGTAAILRTRDGSLRLAVPSPLGQCHFVNEYTDEELKSVLKIHKKYTATFPRNGDGLEAYVDASDTGEPTPAPTNGRSDSPHEDINGVNGHVKKAPIQVVHRDGDGIRDLAYRPRPVQPVKA